ncbi:MAG: amino-acid N-acetyltransferase [Gammaproteobacteria bacterium]|nr:amino-acid N-acetyltransferase [Gammaproteobacteria bacterium]
MDDFVDSMNTSEYARWFRDSTPYISAHRNKTFVVLLGGEALAHRNLTNIVHDLALLHVLGVRLVVVHGARPQIDETLPGSAFHGSRRVTDAVAMETILGIYGQLKSRLEALFSTGLPTSPLHNTDIAVASGNFITARPIGVLDGVDHLFTGVVRKVHTERIDVALANNALVLISPFGYSPSGQAFNLASDDLAAVVAIGLNADKLIAFDDQPYVTDSSGNALTNLTPVQLDALLDDVIPASARANRLHALLKAARGGVKRCHSVSFADDGALLGELFTAQGRGTQISEAHADLVRPANTTDVAGIVELIRPLEEAGVLVRRSRDRLEREIERFLVAEIDGIVVGCCALYPCGTSAELACIAVHESYRKTANNLGIGVSLLSAAEAIAERAGLDNLFVLTTQTHDWFIENGFTDTEIDQLPAPKQSLYNYQRNAKVMVKQLRSR